MMISERSLSEPRVSPSQREFVSSTGLTQPEEMEEEDPVVHSSPEEKLRPAVDRGVRP